MCARSAVEPSPEASEKTETVSARIAALRDAVVARHGSFTQSPNPFLPDVALWRAFRAGRSRVQVRAAYLLELVNAAPIEVREGWRLAGEHLVSGQGLAFCFAGDPDSALVGRIRELGVEENQIEAVRHAVARWQRARLEPCYADTGEAAPGSTLGADPGPTGTRLVYHGLGWMENHSIRDYAKVLRVGFAGIREEIEARLAAANLADADYARRENSWRAALDICDAGCRLGKRYAKHAAELAKQAESPEERERLTQMANMCAQVPARGARTLFEATQALWFAHILTCGEDGINANSIGRLDQILWPYYEADITAGRIDRADAREIMEEFACKLYLDYDVQAITLGGQDREGDDAVNELSYLILEATCNVGLIRDISVRLHRGSPDRFVRFAAEMIVEGGGIPFLFNDDCFVPALSERGIAVEDARNYAPIGCIELTVPGRANPHAVSGWFNSAKCLELALFDGVDPGSDQALGPETGSLESFSDFDDFYEAYCCQVDFFARRMVYHCNRGELAQREAGPLPCWSVLTDDCIARGRDITDGGAVYNYHSICFMGAANTADSLVAIKRLLFDEQRISPEQLRDAIRADFQGHEAVRQLLLKKAPKYGNDIPEVDEMAARVCNHFISLMDTMHSPLGGRYFVHLFSFLSNVGFGRSVGATPDGRRAGTPLAYSVSAQQGRDERGVTAMLNSLARLPHNQAAGASAAIVELDPALVGGPGGAERMAQIIRGAIEMGIGQLQWNVVTAERLRKAQDDPERYGNIPVRVAGYSQMFRLVDKELQNHIIARTKHRH